MDVKARRRDLGPAGSRHGGRSPRGLLSGLRPRLLWALVVVAGLAVASIAVVGLVGPGRSSTESGVQAPPALAVPGNQGGPAMPALWVSDGFGGVRSSAGATAAAATYPQLVCRSVAWTCTVDAEAGSGYVGGPAGSGQATPAARALQQRLSAGKPGTMPKIIVVDAGRFDGAVAGPQLQTAATRYVAALRTSYPGARIALIVPSSPATPRPEYRRVGAVLREVAAAHGAVVVDPFGAGALADTRRNKTLVSDGEDLNAAGQAYYAQVLVRLFMSTGVVEASGGGARPTASREA